MSFLKNIHIPTKMGIPALTSLLGILAVTWLGYSAISEQSTLLDTLFNRSFSREAEIQALSSALTEGHGTLYRTVILSTANASKKDIDEEIKVLNERLTTIKRRADVLREARGADKVERDFLSRFGSDADAYEGQVRAFVDLLGMGVDPLDYMKELQTAYDRLTATGRDYLGDQRRRSNDAYQAVTAKVAEKTRGFMALALVGLIVSVAVAALIGFHIARPVARLTSVMERLAVGEHGVGIPDTTRGDELGQMARAVQVFKENAIRVVELSREQEELRRKSEEAQRAAVNKLAAELEATVNSVMTEVSRSAESMRGEAGALLKNAGDTRVHSNAVADAVREATTEVESVASGAEQLRASIDEINRAITKSAEFARGAVDEASRTDHIVQGLADAGRKIEEVAGLIQSIAGQTNLLALNATIEAARAGDAGRGFAVVASEVKNLAGQTAKATEDIAAEIAAVQAATTAAVNALRSVAAGIRQVDESLGTVAAAIEEQEAATREISERSQRAAGDTSAVMREMGVVQSAAEITGRSAGAVQTASETLTRSFAHLNEEVRAFIERVTRAA